MVHNVLRKKKENKSFGMLFTTNNNIYQRHNNASTLSYSDIMQLIMDLGGWPTTEYFN